MSIRGPFRGSLTLTESTSPAQPWVTAWAKVTPFIANQFGAQAVFTATNTTNTIKVNVQAVLSTGSTAQLTLLARTRAEPDLKTSTEIDICGYIRLQSTRLSTDAADNESVTVKFAAVP